MKRTFLGTFRAFFQRKPFSLSMFHKCGMHSNHSGIIDWIKVFRILSGNHSDYFLRKKRRSFFRRFLELSIIVRATKDFSVLQDNWASIAITLRVAQEPS